jgi:hypothetical protein
MMEMEKERKSDITDKVCKLGLLNGTCVCEFCVRLGRARRSRIRPPN